MAEATPTSTKYFSEKDIENILNELEKMYPDAGCELHFENNFQLIGLPSCFPHRRQTKA